MKRLVPLSLLSVLCAAAFAVSAQTSAPEPAATAQPVPATAAEPGAAEDAIAEDKAKRISDTHCVRETGTRITRRSDQGRCNNLPGRSYSKEDIDRTGHTDLADALRTLDPAIQ
ncbi:hypothetical protein [Pseudoxanthomonas wuyuanensis]